ncbi:hypothetical protein AB0I81_11860 [Nonomuraea sp. NPDC050404]|uniref:hypothetical protein n=1 Tax=Nonomuraea sp. NPDC050404 TaxID=3155783 RepID=UPI0033D96407
MTMIEQWILEDERELEARCARYRSAQSALRRDEQEEDFDGLRPDEPGTAA